MKKAVILARVSTLRQEKEGLSLEDIQLPELRKYAREKELEVVQEFKFSESADQKIRRKFNETVEFVKTNKEIGVIIAYRVDRITRNYRDAVLIDELRLNYDKEVHFVNDRLILTKDTVGRDISDWDLKVFLAKQHINRLKEDQKISAEKMLENGLWPVNAPFGYKNITQENKKPWIVPDPTKSVMVQKIYEWYGTGTTSMDEIRAKMKDVFAYSIHKGMVDKILKNPFYYGKMVYKGKEYYPHKYECLVSQDVYDLVQEVKAGYKRKHYKFAGLPFYYRGLIKCADCGCLVTPERKIKKSGTYHYYHCTQYKGKHGAQWITENEITEQLEKIYKGLELPPEIFDRLLSVLRESHDGKKRFNDEVFQGLTTEYKKYQNRVERMQEDKWDGSITESVFEQKRKEYRQKQEEITKRLQQLQRADEEYYSTAEYIVTIAHNASHLFKSSKVDERRQLLLLSLQNLVLDGKIVRFDLIKPFDTILNFASRQCWLPYWDSTRIETWVRDFLNVQNQINSRVAFR